MRVLWGKGNDVSIYDENGILTYEAVYQLYHQGPTPIRIIAPDLSILAHNPAMNRLCQVLDPQIIGKKCYEIAASKDLCGTEQCPVTLVQGGDVEVVQHYECTLWNGKVLEATTTTTPFYDGNGEIIGFVQVINDQSDLMAFARKLEEKTEELERHLKQVEGFYAISKIFNEEITIEGISNRLLDLLPKVSPVVTGVIYLFDKVQGMLVPVASKGISSTPPAFELGFGLPGQAARDRKPVYLDGVPGEYLRISSGLLVPQRLHVVCLPLVAADDIMGVLELCSLEHLALHEEFFSNIGAQLAVSFQNALYVEKLKEFSQELEEKNERLIAQNEELQAQSEELLAQTEEIQAQAEELAAQRNALEQKTMEAEEANRMKSIFLSNMSHELRTPLNSIIGLVRLLRDGGDEPLSKKQREYLDIVLRNSQNLLELINDILDLTRIEAGREEVNHDVVPLREFVEGVAANVRPLAQSKGLDFELEIASDVPKTILSDQRKIKQILTNLLGNAIKFTDSGSVRLSVGLAGKDGEEVIFEVADTGIGIPEEAKALIFEPFRQVDGSYTRRYGGTGLGLSISKKLTELLGGELSVESEEGRGSVFTLKLPVERRGDGREGDEEWKERLIRALTLREESVASTEDAPASGESGTISPSRPGEKKVLLVDDDMVSAREMGNFLRKRGCKVYFAFDGENGLSIAREERPDLIFLDLKMPVMDGFAFLREMGRDGDLASIPVVILTALELDDRLQKELPDNVKGVLRKGDIVEAEVESLLAGLIGSGAGVQGDETGNGDEVHPPLILVAEDNPDNTFLLKELLTANGFRFLHASNGKEAVELARQNEPDLVIMDIQMPEMDGMEATRAIRQAGLRDVPVIALTAKAMKGDREQILAAGCDDYVSKPFDPAKLIAKIRKWIVPKREAQR